MPSRVLDVFQGDAGLAGADDERSAYPAWPPGLLAVLERFSVGSGSGSAAMFTMVVSRNF